MEGKLGIEHRPERLPGAIYGALITTGLVAALSEQDGLDAGQVAYWTLLTVSVFWLAHVYARVLAERIKAGRPVRRKEARAILWEEWPILRSSLLPSAILVVGWLGALSEESAISLALGLGLVQLLGWSLLIARRERLPAVRAALVVTFTVGFGAMIIALKVLIE